MRGLQFKSMPEHYGQRNTQIDITIRHFDCKDSNENLTTLTRQPILSYL